jgi:hypothetical protein
LFAVWKRVRSLDAIAIKPSWESRILSVKEIGKNFDESYKPGEGHSISKSNPSTSTASPLGPSKGRG